MRSFITLTSVNSLQDTREYDLQGRLLSQGLADTQANPIDQRSYRYDNNSNIQAIDINGATTPYDKAYGYDRLDRLTSDGIAEDNPTHYAYDLNDNRLSKQQSQGTEEETDAIISLILGSNRIANQDILTRGANSIDGLSDREMVYNDAGRLYQLIEAGSLKAEYIYNDIGQRTHKTRYQTDGIGVDTTTLYHYDLMGMLITETDAQGELIKDYLWQGMMPIAQINHAQDTEQILYLYSDHLMTNRLATNATQHIVWRWEGEAFGNTPAQELIGISVNLRFPGQYFDEETNLHYNMMRYYDPELGRYITSDPIGLKGGLNTYVYAMQNSVVNIDFFGLDVIYNGNVILNPQVHDNLHKLDVVLPGYDVIITGGDRYRDANGNIVSASNDQIVLDSAKKSPHLYGQGARGVDLVVPNATNEQIAKAAKDAGFDPARTIHYPKDDHTHLVLPEDSTYNIPQHIVDEFCKQNPAAKMCNPSPPACP